MGVSIAVGLGIGTAGSTAALVGGFIINTVISLAVSSVFAKKPQAPQTNFGVQSQDNLITVRQAVAPARFIYGTRKVGGVVVFMHTTPLVVDVTGAPVFQEFSGTIPPSPAYTVDVNTASATWVSSELVRIVNWDAEEANNIYEDLTPVVVDPQPGEYSILSAGVYAFNAADAGKTIIIHFYSSTTTKTVSGKHLHLVIEFACHECEEIQTLYFDDEYVPLDVNGFATGRLAGGYVNVSKYTGIDDQGPDPTLMSYAPDKWTAAHRLRGRTYIRVTLQKDQDKFPNGIPNITAVIEGKKCYDPRTGLTTFTDNPALCMADYLCNQRFGQKHDYATEIDETLLIAAANVCDEHVTLASGGVENRYTCNGMFETSEQPKDILGRMQASMSGACVRVGGKWKIYAGAYITPNITLDEDDLRGPIQVKTLLSRRDMFNGVKGIYVGPESNWQPADFPAVTNATYQAEDNNEQIFLDVDLPLTQTASTAQRIAKIELERVRQQITVILPCKLSAYVLEPPQTVMLTNSILGFSSKPFVVIESALVVDRDSQGEPYIGVNLTLRETASTVYDWSSGEETTVDPAPDTNLPSPFDIAPPGIPNVTETIYESLGRVSVRANATWAPSPDAQAFRYNFQWRLVGDTEWKEQAGLQSPSAEIQDIAEGVYDFRAQAVNAIGTRSTWSQKRQEIIGKTAPPLNVSAFTVIKSGGFALAQWHQSPDPDVRVDGYIAIRHSPLMSGATWADGITLREFPGASVEGMVSLISGTYMAKFRDSSGNWSVTEATWVVTEGMITGFTTVGTTTQHPTFTGLKTNVAVVGSDLQLDGSTLIDDMLDDIDDWPAGDLGGISPTGEYEFDTYMDLSTVATRRFEADISAVSFDTGDTIDARYESIDAWDAFDGDVINDCDVTLYASITNDNPAATPTWGPYQPFMVADFTCRAIRFRLDFVSGQSTHNIAVSELVVHAKIAA